MGTPPPYGSPYDRQRAMDRQAEIAAWPDAQTASSTWQEPPPDGSTWQEAPSDSSSWQETQSDSSPWQGTPLDSPSWQGAQSAGPGAQGPAQSDSPSWQGAQPADPSAQGPAQPDSPSWQGSQSAGPGAQGPAQPDSSNWQGSQSADPSAQGPVQSHSPSWLGAQADGATWIDSQSESSAAWQEPRSSSPSWQGTPSDSSGPQGTPLDGAGRQGTQSEGPAWDEMTVQDPLGAPVAEPAAANGANGTEAGGTGMAPWAGLDPDATAAWNLEANLDSDLDPEPASFGSGGPNLESTMLDPPAPTSAVPAWAAQPAEPNGLSGGGGGNGSGPAAAGDSSAESIIPDSWFVEPRRPEPGGDEDQPTTQWAPPPEEFGPVPWGNPVPGGAGAPAWDNGSGQEHTALMDPGLHDAQMGGGPGGLGSGYGWPGAVDSPMPGSPGAVGSSAPMGPGMPGLADPGQMGPGQMGPGMPGLADPGQMGPGQMGPGSMGPGQMGAGPMDPTLMGPGPMDPTLMAPGPMDPGAMGAGQMAPGQMAFGPMDPGQLDPGQMGPGQMGAGPMQSGQYGPPPGYPSGPLHREPGKPSKPLIIGVAALVAVAMVAVGLVFWPDGGEGKAQANSTQSAKQQKTGQKQNASSNGAARQQAAAVNTLLNLSRETRGELGRALTQANRCKDLPTAIAGFERVAQRRTNQINRTRQLQVNALANGPRLRNSLLQSFQYSLQVDQAFLTWARQSQGCRGKTRRNGDYRRGQLLSNRATVAKRQVVTLWTPVARKEGFPVRTDSQF